jgi:hypothetical protein
MPLRNSRHAEDKEEECGSNGEICYRCLLIVAGWFLLALFAGETELLALLPGRAEAWTPAALAAGLLGIWMFSNSVRAYLRRVNLRLLIALHGTRLCGFYFLYLSQRGELPARFAIPAGWGEIAIGVGALALAAASRRGLPKPAVLAWNTMGLVELLFASAGAARMMHAGGDWMEPWTRLPLSFLPTLLVPLMVLTHGVVFARLVARSGGAPGAESNPVQTETASAT